MAHHHKKHHQGMMHGGKKGSLNQETEKGGGGSLTKGTGAKGKMNHTGEIAHGIAHVMSHGGKDQHASGEYHKHNKHHGMEDGFSPKDMDNKGPKDPEGNEECC